MLFAAGLGTRLRPLTDQMPKAMIPINGTPLLAHVLKKLERAGFDEVVVNVHHFASMITDYLSGYQTHMNIIISDESSSLLDTGGALKQAVHLFSDHEEPILIHNVDILSNADLAGLYSRKDEADVLLLVSERQTNRYLLFNHDDYLVGWTNTLTHEIRSPFLDTDPARCKKLAFSGIHLFGQNHNFMLDEFPERFPIIDFYLSVCGKIRIKAIVQNGLKLLDIGKHNAYQQAPQFLTELDDKA